VIQYVYRKYTRSRAALAATVICYRGEERAARRRQGARLAARGDRPRGEELCLLDHKIEPANQWFELAQRLRGFPVTFRKQSACSSSRAGRSPSWCRWRTPPCPERTVIQWDKNDLEALGLLKVDVLALGMLSAIRRALEFVGMNMPDVPPEDPAVYAMIQKADTSACSRSSRVRR